MLSETQRCLAEQGHPKTKLGRPPSGLPRRRARECSRIRSACSIPDVPQGSIPGHQGLSDAVFLPVSTRCLSLFADMLAIPAQVQVHNQFGDPSEIVTGEHAICPTTHPSTSAKSETVSAWIKTVLAPTVWIFVCSTFTFGTLRGGSCTAATHRRLLGYLPNSV